MKLVNLTPHEIRIMRKDGSVAEILSPSGGVARVTTITKIIGDYNGAPIYRRQAGETTGLPEPVDGVGLVVSTMVRLANLNRSDLYSPGDLARDSKGQPIGCIGLDCSL